jgi:hypothetical protein
MNLRQLDASLDESLREEVQPGDAFIWKTAVPAYTVRCNQEAE